MSERVGFRLLTSSIRAIRRSAYPENKPERDRNFQYPVIFFWKDPAASRKYFFAYSSLTARSSSGRDLA
jgi:hypothetical protein